MIDIDIIVEDNCLLVMVWKTGKQKWETETGNEIVRVGTTMQEAIFRRLRITWVSKLETIDSKKGLQIRKFTLAEP